MPVIYHEESRNFHLFNEKISYIFTILKTDSLDSCILENGSETERILIIF